MREIKVLLVGINTKYSHTNLAIRYLKNSVTDDKVNVEIYEPNINNSIEDIIRNIYQTKPNLIGFSCYIWNIEMVLKASRSIKEILPEVKILLGGPEVSFEEMSFLKKHTYIDYVIRGEGEVALNELTTELTRGGNKVSNIQGLLTSKYDNGFAKAIDLKDIPFPYQGEDFKKISNKILYYEASRGCPFSCSYCLSSTTKGVRVLELERVKAELRILSRHGRMVKFVDRTFNCNAVTTVELLKYIKKLESNATFHLEISAHLITGEILDILNEMPKNRIQLEIGVQTTNSKSVEAIQRSTDFKKIAGVVKKINSFGNIHQHLDLIAGLPYEDYSSFAKSFNDVMDLKPDKLQLGFLKLLKGSKIRRDKELHQYKFNNFPPYEVLENKYLSYEEMTNLKFIEQLLENYYNSHRFDKSIEWIHKEVGNYFDVYEKMYHFHREKDIVGINHSLKDCYKLLLEFYIFIKGNHKELMVNLLKFDYLSHKRTHDLPSFLGEQIKIKERIFEFLKDEDNVSEFLPNFIDTRPTEIYKQIIIDRFTYNPIKATKGETFLLFNYQIKEDIFGNPKVSIVSLK